MATENKDIDFSSYKVTNDDLKESPFEQIDIKGKHSKLNETYNKWMMNPNDQTTGDFLKASDKTIQSALRTYAPTMTDKLKTRARVMTLDIAKQFKPNKGMQLNSYLLQNLHSLSRLVKERTNPVKLPEYKILEKMRMLNTEKELISELGREPNIQELSDKTGLSNKRIESLRKGSDNMMHESGLLSEEGDSLFTKQGDAQKIWTDYVYHDMDPVDKKIFEWSTGYGGSNKLKKKEIAAKLKITAPAVSSRINKIIKHLEEGATLA